MPKRRCLSIWIIATLFVFQTSQHAVADASCSATNENGDQTCSISCPSGQSAICTNATTSNAPSCSCSGTLDSSHLRSDASCPATNENGQQAQWAAADDVTAQYIIDAERQWAEAACTHNKIAEKILADDFQGTSPEGKRYTKSEEVADTQESSNTARDCRLIDAKVRLFGDDLAMVYGSESSARKAKDGIDKSRCLIWTDTWLKRNGMWQIIAAQDTQFACKKGPTR